MVSVPIQEGGWSEDDADWDDFATGDFESGDDDRF